MATVDFFRARIDAMINLNDPLAVLATRLPWDQIEAALAPMFARRDRPGVTSTDVDLFGPSLAVARRQDRRGGLAPAGPDAGCARLPRQPV
jgi:IS5 family transposase